MRVAPVPLLKVALLCSALSIYASLFILMPLFTKYRKRTASTYDEFHAAQAASLPSMSNGNSVAGTTLEESQLSPTLREVTSWETFHRHPSTVAAMPTTQQLDESLDQNNQPTPSAKRIAIIDSDDEDFKRVHRRTHARAQLPTPAQLQQPFLKEDSDKNRKRIEAWLNNIIPDNQDKTGGPASPRPANARPRGVSHHPRVNALPPGETGARSAVSRLMHTRSTTLFTPDLRPSKAQETPQTRHPPRSGQSHADSTVTRTSSQAPIRRTPRNSLHIMNR